MVSSCIAILRLVLLLLCMAVTSCQAALWTHLSPQCESRAAPVPGSGSMGLSVPVLYASSSCMWRVVCGEEHALCLQADMVFVGRWSSEDWFFFHSALSVWSSRRGRIGHHCGPFVLACLLRIVRYLEGLCVDTILSLRDSELLQLPERHHGCVCRVWEEHAHKEGLRHTCIAIAAYGHRGSVPTAFAPRCRRLPHLK